ncbi:MAG: endopeptidase La [Parcubacteria group bacterium CG10_big_fil_rev_8_21_14_0_10_36_14]|nr:MAG: endopeptidase La [Parcubacteria group bacterium CG10_big_fil_rev_8_21_14_0_10_36_14]
MLNKLANLTNKKEASESKKPIIRAELPLIVISDAVLFPDLTLPISIGDARSVKALDAAMKTDKVIAFCTIKKGKVDDVKKDDIYRTGVAAKIMEVMKQPDGTARILIQGLERIRITDFLTEIPFLKIKIERLSEQREEKSEKIEALIYSTVNQFKECINLGASVPFNILLIVTNLTDPWQLSNLIAVNLDFKTAEKQAILEANSAVEKLSLLNEALGRQKKVLRMARKIQSETGKEIGKMEREMYLREQMKSIEKELGIAGGVSELESLKKQLKEAGMPKEIEEKSMKELARLERMPSFSPEVSFTRTYLDWLVGLPWGKKSESKIDVAGAKKILDEDHFGLEKAKERILEYLSVQKLVGKIKGPILCFSGPPGTGKTSLGKSIARALGRKFIRISLGGIRDEAEIRGHRRTYIGALPGRIIQGINTAGTNNPVFMLDEIDKVGNDFRGDPAAALLEALDPEQNDAFSDHYLEVPFDLSDVMFITTANVLDTIPPALRDRMEIIEFPGYVEEEKNNITKKFLIPKQLKANGLKIGQWKMTDDALKKIIRQYTFEAGVRNLERQIANTMRKVAKQIVDSRGSKAIKIDEKTLQKYLGPAKFELSLAEKDNEVGVVNGLAWTPAGGDIIQIEVNRMPGTGKLILTGHLGKVMKESAQTAFSYVRQITGHNTKTEDVHIHVPAGAIPKDGPSAGIAMATAIASIMINKPVKGGIGMTGEVSLRGRVMEIGGIKEKILAAHRAGVNTIIMPMDNKKNIEDIPMHVRKGIKLLFVRDMKEVLKYALIDKV